MTQVDAHPQSTDQAVEAGRADFYGRASTENLAPLWLVLHGLVTETPKSNCEAAIWKYDEVRPYLMEACGIISAAEAERRVMVLENPGLRGQSRITNSMFGGLQIVLPNEIAPAHRHAAAALRFIIEGSNAYTAVNGERTMMSPGDFVITPSWTWHDHGNLSDEPMVWLDGLDMHIVNLLSASFRDAYPEPSHPITRPDGAADAEFGSNLLPIDAEFGKTSPIFNYPYARTREALQAMASFKALDPCHGHKMKYINPVNGDWAMPTISTSIQLLPKNFGGNPFRSTDSAVFTCVEGQGHTIIGGKRFDWKERDIFVVPSWIPYQHYCSSDAVLFSYSDRVVQEKLGLYREQRGNH